MLANDHPANAVLMRGISARPYLPGYAERFRLRAVAIAAYPMYRGVAQLAGMSVVTPGESPADSFAAARERWGAVRLLLHPRQATDMAGEDGNFAAKVAAIEAVDAALPALLELGPDVLCITGDHSTPVPIKAHSWHPVPAMIHARYAGADRLPRFHEAATRSGSLGVLASRDLMGVLLANAGRLDKFGA